MRTTAAMTIGARARATDYVALAKPRLNLLVVASTVAGYAMAHGDTSNVGALLSTIVGTALVAGGASAFNQVIERDSDGLMRRTRLRPLPDGRLASAEALTFATVLSFAGLLILAAGVNVLAAAVALATLASYAVVYTPLEAADVVRDGDRRDAGRVAAGDRLGGRRERGHAGAGCCSPSSSSGRCRISWPSRGCIATTTRGRLADAAGDRAGRPQHGPAGGAIRGGAAAGGLAPTLVGMSGAAYFAGALVLTLLFLGCRCVSR